MVGAVAVNAFKNATNRVAPVVSTGDVAFVLSMVAWATGAGAGVAEVVAVVFAHVQLTAEVWLKVVA
jgi:hypothetical protein